MSLLAQLGMGLFNTYVAQPEHLEQQREHKDALFEQTRMQNRRALAESGLYKPAAQSYQESMQAIQPQKSQKNLEQMITPLLANLASPETQAKASGAREYTNMLENQVPREGLLNGAKMVQHFLENPNLSNQAGGLISTLINNQGAMDRHLTPNQTTLENTLLMHQLNPPSPYDNVQLDSNGTPIGLNKAGQFQNIPTMPGFVPALKRKEPLFNINLPGQEIEYDKASGKALSEQMNIIQKSGLNSSSKINTLERLQSYLNEVDTGKLTPLATEIAAYGEALGFNVDSNLSVAQASESISKQLALEMRNPNSGPGMPGSMSDKDREFLQATIAGIGKTQGANKLIIETGIKVAKRSQEVAKLARQYAGRNKGRLDYGFYDELQEWSNKNPLFDKALNKENEFTEEEIEEEMEALGL